MILVTGAAGKTGRAIIRALLKRKSSVRALVHNESQIRLVQQLGIQNIIAGDMCSQETMNQALQGVKAVYHICPNVHSEEINIGRILIEVAQSAKIEHFVYHSVLHPQIEAMPHHWQKMRVEEQLFASCLSFTILQPAPYMQNILAYWNDIVQTGKYRLPYSENTRLSCVDLEDVAAVAAIVLCEAGHKYAIYELCGAEILSPNETAQLLSHFLGQIIEVEAIPIETWQANARHHGLGDYQIKALTNMFRYYDKFGFMGNSHVLSCLLNRAPTKFATFLERTQRG